MATARLIDVFQPQIYGSYGSLDNPILLAFIESGIMRNDPVLDALANGPSQHFDVPYWNDLDSSSEPNASTDNPDDIAVPQKINYGTWSGRKSELNNAWSAMDLARELGQEDPMAAMHARTNKYWTIQKQRRLLAICMGIMRANIANNAGDAVKDIALSGAGTPGAGNMLNSDALVDAAFTMGDRSDSVKALALHSVVYKGLVKANLIGQLPIGDGSITVPAFLGKPVLVDDSMPVETVSGNKVYTTAFYAEGAIGFGEGSPQVPAEAFRSELRGNGGGMETFVERKTWLMHPAGHSWNKGNASDAIEVNNPMPTGQQMEANLSNASRWTRVVPRKLLPLAFLRSNG